MTVTNAQISEIAERAAANVEHGWCQGTAMQIAWRPGG